MAEMSINGCFQLTLSNQTEGSRETTTDESNCLLSTYDWKYLKVGNPSPSLSCKHLALERLQLQIESKCGYIL